MKRYILFRGKRTDNGKWIEGYYTKSKWYLSEKEIHVIIPINVVYFPNSEISEWYEIIPETRSEFTGLTDKNGTRIFEGDIVKYGDTIHEVVFEQRNNTAYYGLIYSQIETLPFGNYQDIRQIEVIGNIHDNPELLEGGGDNG